MIKLIASDLDGCLLDGNSSLPPNFKKAFDLMKDRGIVFAAASGRSIGGAKSPFGEFAEEMAFLSDNGARGYYKGRCLFSKTLDVEECADIVNEIRGMESLLPVVCGESGIWIENADKVNGDVEKELLKYFTSWNKCRFEEIPEGIVKYTVLYMGDIEKDVFPLLRKYDNDKICVEVTAKVWIDIHMKSVTKGTGVKALQENLGISREETVVFGDYMNDISMADYAALSFAPANAHPEVIKRFTGTVEANTEYGVTKKIIEMLENSV